jgi:hypothetical protein
MNDDVPTFQKAVACFIYPDIRLSVLRKFTTNISDDGLRLGLSHMVIELNSDTL